MELKEYMNTHFPGLVLKPSLYDQWNNRIHFHFAKGLYQMKEETDELNPDYFHTVYNQAISLFHELFSDRDKILLVTNVYQYIDYIKKGKSKVKVYHRYIKNKEDRFHLKQERLPYLFDEGDADEKCISQFSLECRKQDIRYSLLIKAICNQDFPALKPRLHNRYCLHAPDVFFINVKKGVIFYIYDDRGCEVIARDINTIRPVYEKYVDWVDEYGHEETRVRFK